MIRKLILASLLASSGALAQVSVTNTFSPNTPAVAAEVNQNFQDLVDAINALQSQVDAQAATIATLESELASVQNNTVLDLDGLVSYTVVTDPNTGDGYPTVLVNGANLQVVSGAGSTDATPNGLGNVIVGYNETAAPVRGSPAFPFCSDPFYSDQTSCESNGAFWGIDQRTGSHNLVIGRYNAYSQYGGLIAGESNRLNGRWASVTGGQYNLAQGTYAVTSGGYLNIASGAFSSISGGWSNDATGQAASVSGGTQNLAAGLYSSVSGGSQNIADGFGSAWVGGGRENSALGLGTAVSGGIQNVAIGAYSSVSGGDRNTTSGMTASVGGGTQNTASGDLSSISGGDRNRALGFRASILGGVLNEVGVNADTAAIVGGFSNESTASYGIVVGGQDNTAAAFFSVVSGGNGRSTAVAPNNNFQWVAGDLYVDPDG